MGSQKAKCSLRLLDHGFEGGARQKYKVVLAIPTSPCHIGGMNRKALYRFDTPHFRYARAETALAAILNLDADRQGALRGRLKHLNQLGLPGLKAGKGARVDYTYEQVCQWLMALYMAELGADPVIVVKLVKDQWRHFSRWIRQATDKESASNPVFLTLRLRLMTGTWAKDERQVGVAWVGGFRRYNAKGRSNADVPLDRCAEDGSWLCIRNLTADLNRLQGHLDATEAADTASFTGEST